MKNIFVGIIIGIAVVLSAAILSHGFQSMSEHFGLIAKPDRIVSVRGLSEREVDATLAVWPMAFTVGANSLSDLQKEIEAKTAQATEFLKKYGIKDEDYTIQAPYITDTTTFTYRSSEKPQFIYFGRPTILVRSSDVNAVKNAQEHSLELVGAGVAVSQENDVQYEYTKLNDIKPEMIGEATKNARAAAEQFASDSGSSVGKIKSATQGWFSIDDAAPGLHVRKKIRVVTTVEFILND